MRRTSGIVLVTSLLCVGACSSDESTIDEMVSSTPLIVETTEPAPSTTQFATDRASTASPTSTTTTTTPTSTPYVVPVADVDAVGWGTTHSGYPATDIFAACGTELVSPGQRHRARGSSDRRMGSGGRQPGDARRADGCRARRRWRPLLHGAHGRDRSSGRRRCPSRRRAVRGHGRADGADVGMSPALLDLAAVSRRGVVGSPWRGVAVPVSRCLAGR